MIRPVQWRRSLNTRSYKPLHCLVSEHRPCYVFLLRIASALSDTIPSWSTEYFGRHWENLWDKGSGAHPLLTLEGWVPPNLRQLEMNQINLVRTQHVALRSFGQAVEDLSCSILKNGDWSTNILLIYLFRLSPHFALLFFFLLWSSFRSFSLRIPSRPSFLLVKSITSSVLMVLLPACLANDSRSIAAFPARRSPLASIQTCTNLFCPVAPKRCRVTDQFAPKPTPSSSR